MLSTDGCWRWALQVEGRWQRKLQVEGGNGKISTSSTRYRESVWRGCRRELSRIDRPCFRPSPMWLRVTQHFRHPIGPQSNRLAEPPILTGERTTQAGEAGRQARRLMSSSSLVLIGDHNEKCFPRTPHTYISFGLDASTYVLKTVDRSFWLLIAAILQLH